VNFATRIVLDLDSSFMPALKRDWESHGERGVQVDEVHRW